MYIHARARAPARVGRLAWNWPAVGRDATREAFEDIIKRRDWSHVHCRHWIPRAQKHEESV